MIVQADFSKLEKLISNLKEKHFVDVGVLGDGAGRTEGGEITTAGIAAVHEFGTDKAGRGNSVKIEKRSVIMLALTKRQKQIAEAVDNRKNKHIEDGDIRAIFVDLGLACEAEIQNAFDTGGFGAWKANTESTIARKGSDTPLIDKGLLRKSYTSKVGP